MYDIQVESSCRPRRVSIYATTNARRELRNEGRWGDRRDVGQHNSTGPQLRMRTQNRLGRRIYVELSIAAEDAPTSRLENAEDALEHADGWSLSSVHPLRIGAPTSGNVSLSTSTGVGALTDLEAG
eukprot:CAMPEP_0197417368 /NCGR_PEP_ID=MMETSP1170-20131217/3425_1 /TAXON_ID=54406 /ORGANISM="Sarcinochrysis sp, Strain CCMP770" /LENGTH=125 /DNA_ID=CAMNT_0042944329 /DNA_START=279 /DNA_END=657 /DNA_ORIENTATION=-